MFTRTDLKITRDGPASSAIVGGTKKDNPAEAGLVTHIPERADSFNVDWPCAFPKKNSVSPSLCELPTSSLRGTLNLRHRLVGRRLRLLGCL